tara:strand:- start:453 stop:722 length:270 start_codon:yes stop_codon:yes gene_type:complete
MDIKDKLVRTTVQLRSSQHKALENLSGPGKSISALVRTALDKYLNPYYEQNCENQKLDKMLNEAESRMERLSEGVTEMEDIFATLKSKV